MQISLIILLMPNLCGDIFLRDVDLVAETERHSLALGSDANMTGDGRRLAATERLLHAHVRQCVFAEDRACVQVRRQEAAIT